MASSHQHPLLQSSDLEYGSPTASLHFAAHSASGRLGQPGRLLELQIEGDGTCSIMPLEESSTLFCPGLLSNIYCGTAPPDQIAAADIVGASTSGSELTIWHAPLDKPHSDKPSRRMQQLALQLESEDAAAQAAAHLRSTCCWQGFEVQEAPRLLVIVNPASGPGKGPRIYERQVLPALQAAGARLTMHTTREPLHATAIVKGVAPGSVDGIVAIGGDGTMYEVLQGMLARPDWQPLAAIPFAQIPCGSGNALAASMGMWTWDTAVHAIVKGQQRALDVATVLQASPPRRCFSFLSINFGLITNLDIGTEHLRWMGGTRFVVGALQQILLKRKHAARVALLEPAADGAGSGSAAAAATVAAAADGQQAGVQPPAAAQQQAEALAAAAAQPGPPVQQLAAFQQLAARQLPPGWQWLPDPEVALFTATNLPRLDMNFHLAPDATADSGHFNLIYTPPASRRQGFELLSASEKGAHMHLVKQRRVAAMSLEPQSTGTWLVVDGEAMPYVPMYLEVHPSLCRAIVAPTASLCGALRPAEEAALLLEASKSWTNWPAALDSPGCRAAPGLAWISDTLPCGTSAANSSWRGVGCNAHGQVAELSLSGCGLTGVLPPELGSLPHLQTIDLSHNALAGSIPKRWTAVGGLPALQTLQLANNSLVGGLTDFTPVGTGFMSSLYFNVSGNHLNQSTIPPDWYSKTLALLDLSFNNITSTLPPEWGYPKEGHESEYPSAFPSLARLAIEGNNISGPFDPWPGGGATCFSPDFLCTGKPGNPYLLKTPPRPALNSSSGSGGLSGGAIAGIVVGCVAAAALAAALAFFVVRRRRRHRAAVAAGDAEKGSAGGSGADQKGAGTGPTPGPAGGAAVGSKDSAGTVAHGSARDSRGSAKTSQFESGSMDSAFAAAAAAGPDTDPAQLPADWNTVDFKDLELSQQLGSGSFGSVWLAHYCQTTVAVKILGGDKAPGATDSVHQRSITRQLKKEAGLMSKLRHSNIVLYMGVCAEPPCLLMEHCSRKGLDDLLAQGRRDPRVAKQLRWPRLLSMALDAAKGMLYLHTRSPAINHRDLKTANLLVTSQYQVKVADFNLSRTLSNTNFMSTLCIQNPRWLAPEVLAGEAGGLPADCWAFGTVLWELMTWAPPFDGLNPYQIINTVQAAERGSGLAVPPQDQLPAGPLGQYADYVALMEDCWERDPAKRPTFEEVVNRLRAMLAIEARRHSSALSSGALPSVASSSAPSPQASIPLPRTASAPRGTPSSNGSATAAAVQRPATGQGSAGSSGASISPFSTSTDAGGSAAGSAGFSGAAEAAADLASPCAVSPFAAAAGCDAQ